MTYQIPKYINRDKIFIVNRSEIEGRLEPEYYKPSIACLEAKIRSLSSKKLRYYALSFAGGATPKKSGGDNYYSNSDLAEILEIEQPIPDEYFYNQWLNNEETNDR